MMARITEAGYPPLMLAQAEALRAYACAGGRCWKMKLRMEWMDATADPLLHQLRNSHGPVWLNNLELASILAISEEQNHVVQC